MTVTKDTVSPMLATIIEALDAEYVIHAEIGSQESADKIDSLKASGRDFLKPTPQMADAAVRAASTVLQRQLRSTGAVDMRPVFQALAEGAWTHILIRFKGGKRDVPMKALSKGWVAHKVAEGRPANIGVYKGDLLTDLSNATVTVTKK